MVGAQPGSDVFSFLPTRLPRPLPERIEPPDDEDGPGSLTAPVVLTALLPVAARAGQLGTVTVVGETHGNNVLGFDAFAGTTVPALRRFGLYAWDQGPGLPGDWNGRLAPAFELVFHFNRAARQANKIVPCKWAGDPLHMTGLRRADGTMSGCTHEGRPIQPFRVPDSVLRITRHKARGIETEHPAVFPVALPEFLMRAYTDEGEVVFEPFSGSGTTILAGQRTGRRVRAIELAPEYVDLAIARWRMLHPDLPVTLAGDGREYDAVAAERAETLADAA
jgi:hypothetical protein